MQIKYSKSALKNIKALDGSIKERVRNGIEKIPFGDIKKLQGYGNLYRLRVGEYRILYMAGEDFIYIEAVLPRGEVYKRL